jgi:PAS domain S-box-containing protein
MTIASESPNPLSETLFVGGGKMGALMRSRFACAEGNANWSQTPLGAIETWSQSLRTAVGICLSSLVPQCVIWGREFVLLYNEEYRSLIADDHPQAFGRSIGENKSEFWQTLRPILEDVLQTGQPAYLTNDLQRIEPNRALQEAHSSFSPIFDETGQVAGIFHTAIRATPNSKATTAQTSETEQLEDSTLKQLRESEAKYRTLFESIDEGFCIFELICDESGFLVDWRWLEVNQAYEKYSGLAGVVGKLGSEIAPGLETYWLEIFDRVARTGVSERHENYSGPIDRWVSAAFSRVGGEGSRLIALVFNDITERKRAEAVQQAFFSNISHEFRTPLTLLMGGIQAVLDDSTHPPTSYAEIEDDGETYFLADNFVSQTQPKLIGRFPTRDFGEVSERARAGETFATEDVNSTETLNEAARAAFLGLDIHAFISVPLIKDSVWVANFGVYHAAPRAWTSDEIAIVQETADRTWAAVERAQVEADLGKSEEKYRKIFENIDQGFSIHELIIDESDHVTDVILQEVNEAFEQHTGIKNAQGKKVSEIVPKLEPVWLDAMTRAYQWGETQHFEAYNSDTNRWITSQYSRLGGAGSRLLSTVFTDITERKQRELNTALLDEISKDLSRLSAPDEIMQTVGKRLCEFLKLSGCYFVDVDEAKNEVAVHQAGQFFACPA